MKDAPWTIVGQGLAGTCLAWELWQRKAAFTILDREQGGSSRVAAGLINPVTGRNYEASRDIAVFLPQAMDFYQSIERQLGVQVWHPHPILRLAADEREWRKMQSKSQQQDVARWIARDGKPFAIDGWLGAIELHGGGRLDTVTFLDASRDFFRQRGCYRKAVVAVNDTTPNTIWCEGAHGLISGRYGSHRCAKGEILTVAATDWDKSTIRIGGGGWLVPIGSGLFKVGATYQWEPLDEAPSATGLEQLRAIAHRLGGGAFEVIDHQAGIRPILRRSEALIGPIGSDQWMFNALGSKGSLYAPGIAARLAAWIIDGTPCDSHYDMREWMRKD